jgi:hypothetical protein
MTKQNLEVAKLTLSAVLDVIALVAWKHRHRKASIMLAETSHIEAHFGKCSKIELKFHRKKSQTKKIPRRSTASDNLSRSGDGFEEMVLTMMKSGFLFTSNSNHENMRQN